MDVFTHPAFRNEDEAYRFLESRIWPDGPVCSHCGSRSSIGRLRGTTSKPGTMKCYSCRKPFNVKLGTLLEGSHLPLHLWLQALFLLHSCRNPVSVSRLSKLLGVSSRTTWLMSQRFAEGFAATDPSLEDLEEAPPERLPARRTHEPFGPHVRQMEVA